MDTNEKKLIQLNTKLDKKIKKVMNGELTLQVWSSEVYDKITRMEVELSDLKSILNLPNDKE